MTNPSYAAYAAMTAAKAEITKAQEAMAEKTANRNYTKQARDEAKAAYDALKSALTAIESAENYV